MTLYQYYYANHSDIEKCWHDQGTGPFPTVKVDDVPLDKTGRGLDYVEIPIEARPPNWPSTWPPAGPRARARPCRTKLTWRAVAAPGLQELVDPSQEIDKPSSIEMNNTAFPKPITDRPPTENDADHNDYVQVLSEEGWCIYYWKNVGELPWVRTPYWKEKTNTDVLEEAIDALSRVRSRQPNKEEDLEKIHRALELACQQQSTRSF